MPKTYLRRRNHKFANPRLSDSSVNDTKPAEQAVFSARIEPDVKAKIDEWISETGWTKKQATMFAFEHMMAEYSPAKARRIEPK